LLQVLAGVDDRTGEQASSAIGSCFAIVCAIVKGILLLALILISLLCKLVKKLLWDWPSRLLNIVTCGKWPCGKGTSDGEDEDGIIVAVYY
jgi:hypothetical protein